MFLSILIYPMFAMVLLSMWVVLVLGVSGQT